MINALLSVAIGGALGAMTRYGVGLYVASHSAAIPAFVATLCVNIIGCALMGVMAALGQLYPAIDAAWRPLIMIGFLGALTTFSSFALDSFHLLEKQAYGTLAFYMTASFVVSLMAFLASYHLAKGAFGS